MIRSSRLLHRKTSFSNPIGTCKSIYTKHFAHLHTRKVSMLLMSSNSVNFWDKSSNRWGNIIDVPPKFVIFRRSVLWRYYWQQTWLIRSTRIGRRMWVIVCWRLRIRILIMIFRNLELLFPTLLSRQFHRLTSLHAGGMLNWKVTVGKSKKSKFGGDCVIQQHLRCMKIGPNQTSSQFKRSWSSFLTNLQMDCAWYVCCIGVWKQRCCICQVIPLQYSNEQSFELENAKFTTLKWGTFCTACDVFLVKIFHFLQTSRHKEDAQIGCSSKI